MAKKRTILKSGGNNRYGVGPAYQWQPGTTFRQVAGYLANDPHSGLSKGRYKKVGWGKQEWVQDLDDYDPTGRVMEYLRRQPAEVQKHYGVYDMLNGSRQTTRSGSANSQRRSAAVRRQSGSRMNYDGMSFNQAFAAANRAGMKTFNWRGRSYTTQLAEDVNPEPVAQTTQEPLFVAPPTLEPEPLVERGTGEANRNKRS